MESSPIVSVGSDASYDLLMQALTIGTQQHPCLLVCNKEFKSMAQIFIADIESRIIRENKFYLKISLFQRFPDFWVWNARLNALFEKFDSKIQGKSYL